MNEQLPTTPNPEAQDPAAQEMQGRIDTATPEQVWDGLMLHAADIAEKTKHIETTRAQGRDIPEEAFMNYVADATELQAVGSLYKEWSGLEEDGRPGFKDYVDEQDRQRHSFDAEGNTTVDEQRASDLFSASAWMDENFNKTMKYSLWAADRGEPPKRPEREFGLGSAHFMKHKMERNSKLAEMRKNWSHEQTTSEQEAQQREAAETTRKEVVASEAKSNVEAIHDQSELTAAIVEMGKDKTHVYAYGERGFGHYGAMKKDKAKQIMKHVHDTANYAFGTDHMGNVRKPEGVDWREAGIGERVLFMPSVEQDFRTETRTEVVEKKRFGKDITREVPYQVAVPGSEHQKMIVNPETSQQEPAVLFQYDFDPSALGHDGSRAIYYKGLTDNRGGAAVLHVALELPKSVADRLLANIEKQPDYVRKVAEALVVHNSDGRISQEDWDKGRPPFENPLKPPYDKVRELAPNWKIAIAKPKPGADITEFVGYQKGQNLDVTKLKVA